METDRLDTCSTCQEESCNCSEVCDKCKGWSAQCACEDAQAIAHTCSDCNETSEADLEVDTVDGESVAYPICSACGSPNVNKVDKGEIANV